MIVSKKSERNSPIHVDLTFEFGRKYNDIEVFLTNGNDSIFPLSSFGTGVQQVLFILAKIAEKKPKIILLEEIELNLSPRYQYELLQHISVKLKERIFQLIFTTHSPLLVANSQYKVYNVTISENGETSVAKIGGELRETISKFYPQEIMKV